VRRSPTRPPPRPCRVVDDDGDGLISLEELAAYLDSRSPQA
jgi:hypothetical protein